MCRMTTQSLFEGVFMKKCFKCGEEKPLDEFYTHIGMADGHLGKCKECAKEDTKKNYLLKREKYTKYERARAQTPKRKAMAIMYQKKRRLRSPQKYKANTMVGNAIRDGYLKKQPCVICGDENSQAHHDNYDLPFQVVWLCRAHHLERHGKIPYEFPKHGEADKYNDALP